MIIKSQKIDATATGEINLTDGIDDVARVFIGITFYSSGSIVTPSAGTYTIEICPVGMNNFAGIIRGEDVDATLEAPILSYARNANTLRYTPTGVTGSDKVEITLTGEE